MIDPVATVLVGIGGFGAHLMGLMLEQGPAQGLRLVAAVDPAAERAPSSASALAAAGIPCHRDLDALGDCSGLELAVIASPIAWHARQTCHFLERGVPVLCEKPAAATLADAHSMAAAARRAGRICAIGFQWSFAEATRLLKAALAAGRFGAPRAVDIVTCWPRGPKYYERNDWAGRRLDAAGRPVHDDPVLNATAHHLHHALFLLGGRPDAAAWPKTLAAELYRARPIDTFDAAALELCTTSGVVIRFLTAHCCAAQFGPLFAIHCEDAILSYAANQGFVARWHDGRTEVFGDPNPESAHKLWRMANAVRTGVPVDCPIEAALPHLTVAEALRSLPVHAVPSSLESWRDEQVPVPPGLAGLWIQAFAAGCLPHATGLATWTQPAETAALPPRPAGDGPG